MRKFLDESINFKRLREQLSLLFNIDEIKTLCFDLGIEYENIPGDTLDGKTRELVNYCYKKGMLSKLLLECANSHPHINWNDTEKSDNGIETNGNKNPLQPFYLLAKAFNRNRHLPYSIDRTLEGDEIVFQMRELAPEMYGVIEVSRWLNNKNKGKRIAAITYLHWAQDIEFFDVLIERLFLERPFVQFHILLTLDNMLNQLDSQEEKYLLTKLNEYKTEEGSSRHYWKQQIIEAISGSVSKRDSAF